MVLMIIYFFFFLLFFLLRESTFSFCQMYPLVTALSQTSYSEVGNGSSGSIWAENFLSSWSRISSWRRTLLQGVKLPMKIVMTVVLQYVRSGAPRLLCSVSAVPPLPCLLISRQRLLLAHERSHLLAQNLFAPLSQCISRLEWLVKWGSASALFKVGLFLW